VSRGGARAWWAVGLFGAHLLQALWFAHLYPESRYDTDLLAYFVYFRNWLAHDTSLQQVSYFVQPKPLLVFTLGPMANVSLAFACSALASATLGSLVYLIGCQAFGPATGLLFSGLLLLDGSKGILTLKSSADLYVACFLFLTVYLAQVGRLGAASVALLLSALVKPVTAPCAVYFLTREDQGTRRWIWAAVPLLALPLTLLSNQVLLGGIHISDQFLREFPTLRDAPAIGPGEVLHFALWTQLIKNRFLSSASWGLVGLILWIAADRRRLTSPLLLIPLLFVGGYLLLSVVAPYMPFFRFYWPLEVWFLGFVAFGIVESARRLASGRQGVQVAVTAVLLCFVTDDYVVHQLSYRDNFALPFEAGMTFVRSAGSVLQQQRRTDQNILAPLTFLPYLMWELPGRAELFLSAEQASVQEAGASPDWVLDVPAIYGSPRAREFVARLVGAGEYTPQLTDGKAALLVRRPRLSTAAPPARRPVIAVAAGARYVGGALASRRRRLDTRPGA